MRKTIAAALAVLTLGVLIPGATVGSDEPDVTVRIVARKIADGRIEFGLRQQQADGTYGPEILPRSRFFPADAQVGRWLRSSPVDLAVGSTPAVQRPVTSTTQSNTATSAEYTGGGYTRSHYEHNSRHLCNSAGADPYTGLTYTSATCDVDHIVAAKEAHESGAHAWTVARRNEFGRDPLNLTPSRDCVNRSKSDNDIAEWSGRIASGTCAGTTMTNAGACFFARKTEQVKTKWGLSVDAAERQALDRALARCGQSDARPVTTTTTNAARPSGTCTHWHAGHPKHTHPGTNHDGTHQSGKCAGY